MSERMTPYVDPRLAAASAHYTQDLRVERLPHAGHFVHWHDPGTVTALLLSHLSV